jgi:hypothetical protein
MQLIVDAIDIRGQICPLDRVSNVLAATNTNQPTLDLLILDQ